MTLIELLVVIVILTTVVAAAIPIMAPSNDDRRLREATRGLNTFITGAQAHAIATGRPFGILLKRLSADTGRSAPITPSNPDNDNGVCLEVFYMEELPPFTGFDRNSRACVSIRSNGLVEIRFITRGSTGPDLPPGWAIDLFPGGTVRPGDVIEIGDTRYEIALPPGRGRQVQQSSNIQLNPATGYLETLRANLPASVIGQPINDTGQQINPIHDDDGNEIGPGSQPPYWTGPMPYRILRQPTITSDEPYQLPEGTAIDLRASGIGSDDYFYVPAITDNTDGVVIMFAPEGRVSRVSFGLFPNTSSLEPTRYDEAVADNLFLLVGKRENIPAPAPNVDPTLRGGAPLTTATTDEQRQELKKPINWLSGNSRWVVIGSQSGRIVTVENAFVDPLAILNQYTQAPYSLNASSEPLRNAQILAAREFTREMNQLGGR